MNYSQITDDLYVGTTPSQADYERLRRLGVRLVINMRFVHGQRPRAGNPSMEYMRLRTFDSPLLPIPIAALVRGAQAAIEVLHRGGKVYAHCSRGRHRGVAMTAAILIARGLSADEAISLIKQKRAEADPEAGYIKRRILLFEQRWRERSPRGEGIGDGEAIGQRGE